jgi:2-dehydro-3-deoxygluconokinase
MTRLPPDILSMGEPMVEFVRMTEPDGRTWYRPGFGGDTSNAAIAAARHGASVGYFTALGADEFGDDLMDLWAREGVDASQVIRSDEAQTGIYFIRPHGSERHFTYFRAGSAASRITPANVPRDYVGAVRMFHASAISQAVSESARDTVARAMAVARAGGARISYDTNLRLKLWPLDTARAVIDATMGVADIALPSLDDSTVLTGLADPDAVVDHYLALGPAIVALKMGEQGALIATPERRERIAPVAVEAVDSTGAGDAFAGAFLAWLLETGDPFEAGRRAAFVAARTVTGLGAIDPIPSRAETVAALGG